MLEIFYQGDNYLYLVGILGIILLYTRKKNAITLMYKNIICYFSLPVIMKNMK